MRRRKSEKTKYKEKAITLAKRIVREREKRCQWCGRTDGVLHGAHIISVRYSATAADTNNILCLCYRCHFYKWHSDPDEAITWFDSQFPGKREKLRRQAEAGTGFTEEEWKEIHQKLKEEYELGK